jgi:predicted nuclease of predicted toxin-antitoxin system
VRHALEAAGYEVLRAAGPEEEHPDADLLRLSDEQGLIIVTEDSDIDQWAIWRRRSHCGILRVAHVTPSEAAARILETLAEHGSELAKGAVIIVKAGRTRIIGRHSKLDSDNA